MNLKQRIPLLRWSVWRLVVGARNVSTTGQIGDGREVAAADYVIGNARRGDIDEVLASIDTFAYEKSMLINVGDEKGALLDAAVGRADPKAYLPDLLSIVDRGWLHPGSIVVADNVRVPGSPKYRAYMREQQGKKWDTIEHKTHVEYQTLVPDLVVESTYLG